MKIIFNALSMIFQAFRQIYSSLNLVKSSI